MLGRAPKKGSSGMIVSGATLGTGSRVTRAFWERYVSKRRSVGGALVSTPSSRELFPGTWTKGEWWNSPKPSVSASRTIR